MQVKCFWDSLIGKHCKTAKCKLLFILSLWEILGSANNKKKWKNCNCWRACLKLIILDGYQDLSIPKGKVTYSDSWVWVFMHSPFPNLAKEINHLSFSCFCHLKIITKRCLFKGLWIKAMTLQLFSLSAKWNKALLVWETAECEKDLPVITA